MKNEEWRTVVIDGEIYEGYEVSNQGRVRSLNYRGTGKVKELRLIVDNGGYLTVRLRKDGKTKSCLVHRLVAYAFIPNDNPTEKTEVNHIDENKINNRTDNLEWCNREQNINHGTRTERSVKAKSKKVKCIETNVVYESIIDVERKLGLNHSHISKCCKGKTKTCGGYHWMYYEDYLEQQNKEKSDSNNNKVA